MGSNDLLLLLIPVGGIAVAYGTNFGGFKDWVDNALHFGSVSGGGGSSGNCSSDSTGHYCWSSAACGAACKTCINVGTGPTNATGCAKARSYFLSQSSKCPGCKRTTGLPYLPPPTGCPQCTVRGTRAVKINGVCKCEKVPNALGLAGYYNTNIGFSDSISVS